MNMDEKIARFFARYDIEPSELKYLHHKKKKTFLYTTDGREVSTFTPLKNILAYLPDGDFWNIQKGIVVAAQYVLTVDDEGVYTMIDGEKFQGRKRNLAQHKRRRREWELSSAREKSNFPLPLLEKCRLMENAPIAFCVIELIFAEDNQGLDFIFRYCNKEMEVLEGVAVSDMINRSFYKVFKNGDKKWIVPYADVALNGNCHIIRDFSPEINRNLIIRCFQPEPGYCACLLSFAEEGAV